MDRKGFIKRSVIGAGVIWAPGAFIQDKVVFEQEEISDLVRAAHSDFDETKRIIEAKPLLLNCANQLKKGDFETAMGGASHMGRRDIADFLLSKGARLDMFNLTFLGYDELVKQLIVDFPFLLDAPGPHGFTLLHHAKVGERLEMMEWLQEQGLTDTFIKGSFG